MSGLKYKLAHKRFDKEKWSASDQAQRKGLIKVFEEMISQLENEIEQVEARKKEMQKVSK